VEPLALRPGILKAAQFGCDAVGNKDRQQGLLAMSISSVGASPYSAAPAAPTSDPGDAGTPGTPGAANAQDCGDTAAPLPPVQAATAPGTGQKVDIMA